MIRRFLNILIREFYICILFCIDENRDMREIYMFSYTQPENRSRRLNDFFVIYNTKNAYMYF